MFIKDWLAEYGNFFRRYYKWFLVPFALLFGLTLVMVFLKEKNLPSPFEYVIY